MATQFDLWLEEPQQYQAMALKECGVFPEGRLYPFILPAMAYANMAISGDLDKDLAAKQMRHLLDMAIPQVGKFIEAPANDLMQMSTYARHGTFLSTLNIAIGHYRLISDDPRYNKIHDYLSHLLLAALKAKQGGPIDSYPQYTWYFDTIMALASLGIWDHLNHTDFANPLLEAHLAWRKTNATVADTNLPRARPGDSSRGCDLSMQVSLLANMKPMVARELYDNYVKTHWVDFGIAAGFREWPVNVHAPIGGDIDSGPVLMGIGSTASGIGIAATKAMSDEQRLNSLTLQLDTVSQLFHRLLAVEQQQSTQLWLGKDLQINKSCYTGFLYGDAALFYALTWTPFPYINTEK
ncbi:MAG TPA: hypothetical protein DCM28_06360 [Phycisphaerales bacterium]|nr:hypothetical protein [Phycisphaerales bacterium]